MSIRTVYIGTMRLLRRLLDSLGALDRMEMSSRPAIRHLRTMLAIYDTVDLVHLGLPWWTYKAIDRVEGFLQGRDARVFEYGSGASTVWLAQRAGEIYSVEHDEEFANLVGSLISGFDNVTLLTVPPKEAMGSAAAPSGRRGYENMDFIEYVETIGQVGGEFDLIVVDGRARVSCALWAFRYLKPGGILLFDDLRRNRYRSIFEMIGGRVEVLSGAKPCIPYRDTTALISKKAHD